MQGVDPIFIAPWFLLAAVAAGVGLRRGARDGAKRGFAAAAKVSLVGIVVLLILFAAMIAFYYATGGH